MFFIFVVYVDIYSELCTLIFVLVTKNLNNKYKEIIITINAIR